MVGGALWAVALFAAAGIGPVAVAVVATPVVLLAVLTAWRAGAVASRAGGRPAAGGAGGRARRRLPAGPARYALVLLGVTPFAALAGIAGVVVVVAAALAALALAGLAPNPVAGKAPAPNAVGREATDRTVLAGVAAPAFAGGFLVLCSRQGTELVVVMIVAVLLFDVANAVMGRVPTGGAVGAVSGALTVVVLAAIVNALLDPPFTGASSLVLCVLVAVGAPAGVALCARLVPGRVPAVRRLDALAVAAPLWWLGVIVLLHR